MFVVTSKANKRISEHQGLLIFVYKASCTFFMCQFKLAVWWIKIYTDHRDEEHDGVLVTSGGHWDKLG